MLILPIIVCSLVFGASLAAFAVHMVIDRSAKSKRETGPLWMTSMVISWSGLIIFFLLLVAALFPFNPKYWFLSDVDGTVTGLQTQTVITDTGETQLTSESVLTLDDKTEVVVADPRIQNVQVGEEIQLSCSYEFIYGGSDLLKCNIR